MPQKQKNGKGGAKKIGRSKRAKDMAMSKYVRGKISLNSTLNNLIMEEPITSAEEVLDGKREDYWQLTGMDDEARKIIIQAMEEYAGQFK